MNKNFVRIGIGSLWGIAVLTVLMLLLKRPTPLMWMAYGWSVWALAAFAIALGYWARGQKIDYVLSAAYPLMVKTYLFSTLVIAFIFGSLSFFRIWSMPIGYFALIEFALLAIFAWKLLAMNAGKDAISATEEAVKINTISWKMLIADAAAIVERTADADKKTVARLAEAIRYADPVEHPAVAGIVENIHGKIAELGAAVDAGESEKIADICTAVDRLIKERASKLMIIE